MPRDQRRKGRRNMNEILTNREKVVANNDSILRHILICLREGHGEAVNVDAIEAACGGRFDAAQCAARIIEASGMRTDVCNTEALMCWIAGHDYAHSDLCAWFISEEIYKGVATLADTDTQAIAHLCGEMEMKESVVKWENVEVFAVWDELTGCWRHAVHCDRLEGAVEIRPLTADETAELRRMQDADYDQRQELEDKAQA